MSPEVLLDAPSPWSGPITETQLPSVVKASHNIQDAGRQIWSESPWAGPVLDEQPVEAVVAAVLEQALEPVAQPILVQSNESVAVPEASLDGHLLPSWMSDLCSEATTDDAVQAPVQESQVAEASLQSQSGESDSLEVLLNSIPDEEFAVDNDVMRSLFTPANAVKVCEAKVEVLANTEATDLAIVVSPGATDNIQIVSSQAVIESKATASDAEFEAMQKAYAMLDLSPMPPEQKNEGFFEAVFNMIEKSTPQVAPSSIAADPRNTGTEQACESEKLSNISRTQRGTIEMATHANGRQIKPQYNFCGILTSVEISDDICFVLTEEKSTWQMTDKAGKVMTRDIRSVSFDKQGNLSYVTKGGDTTTLKLDGTVETKFAKNGAKVATDESLQGEADAEVEKVASKPKAKPVKSRESKPKPKAKAAVKEAAKPSKTRQSKSKAKSEAKAIKSRS